MGLFKNLGDEEVSYTVDGSHAYFNVGNETSFKIRVIDAKYPNYEAVIPEGNDKSFTVDVKEFLTSVKRVSLFSNSDTKQVILTLGKEFTTISGQDINYNTSAKELVKGSYEGEDMEVGFNSRYLVSLLNVLGDGSVKMTFSHPSKPVLMYSEKLPKMTQLVMPIAI